MFTEVLKYSIDILLCFNFFSYFYLHVVFSKVFVKRHLLHFPY